MPVSVFADKRREERNKMKSYILTLVLAGFGLMSGWQSGFSASAAPTTGFDVPWWTVDGGGGDVSSGGGFEVTGTIGQPDAASSLASGCWSVDPGFWGEYAVVAMPGDPALRIRLLNANTVRISFNPGCGDWVLQRAATLNTEAPPTAWTDDPASELIPVGDELVRDFHIPSWSPRQFFRLRKL